MKPPELLGTVSFGLGLIVEVHLVFGVLAGEIHRNGTVVFLAGLLGSTALQAGLLAGEKGFNDGACYALADAGKELIAFPDGKAAFPVAAAEEVLTLQYGRATFGAIADGDLFCAGQLDLKLEKFTAEVGDQETVEAFAGLAGNAALQQDALAGQHGFDQAGVRFMAQSCQALIIFPDGEFAVFIGAAKEFLAFHHVAAAFGALAQDFLFGAGEICLIQCDAVAGREGITDLEEGRSDAVFNADLTAVDAFEHAAQLGCLLFIHVDAQLVEGFDEVFATGENSIDVILQGDIVGVDGVFDNTGTGGFRSDLNAFKDGLVFLGVRFCSGLDLALPFPCLVFLMGCGCLLFEGVFQEVIEGIHRIVLGRRGLLLYRLEVDVDSIALGELGKNLIAAAYVVVLHPALADEDVAIQLEGFQTSIDLNGNGGTVYQTVF